MKIKLICVSGANPEWLQTGLDQYTQRIGGAWQLEQCRLPQLRRSRSITAAQCRIREGKNILAELGANDHAILLDEQGEALSTRKWATKLEKISVRGKRPVFIIGGADGVADDVKKRAQSSWSLSSLTLAHHIAQLVLAEQLYRVASIKANHPYHRD